MTDDQTTPVRVAMWIETAGPGQWVLSQQLHPIDAHRLSIRIEDDFRIPAMVLGLFEHFSEGRPSWWDFDTQRRKERIPDAEGGKYVLSALELGELFVFDADGAGTLDDVVLTGHGDQPGQVASMFAVGSMTPDEWEAHRQHVLVAEKSAVAAIDRVWVRKDVCVRSGNKVFRGDLDLNRIPKYDRLAIAQDWIDRRPLADA